MITWENYEEYMVMHADGELIPAQEQQLMSFLYEHPELQSELTAFTMTKMIPDARETYTHKASLLKQEPMATPAPQPKVVALPLWRRYAVAAGIAALVFASGYGVYISNKGMDNVNGVAANTAKPTVTAPSSLAPAPASQTTAPAVQTPATQTNQDAVATTEAKRSSKVPHTSRAINKPNTTRVPVEYAYAHTVIDPVAAAAVKEFSAEQKNMAPAVTNVPALAIQYREDDNEVATAGSFIDKLPVADTKKDGMKSLANDAADQYSKVNAIRKEIENANVTVSIKNKKLIFSF